MDDEAPVVQPPGSFTVESERKPILYTPDGKALVRRPVGFDTGSTLRGGVQPDGKRPRT